MYTYIPIIKVKTKSNKNKLKGLFEKESIL